MFFPDYTGVSSASSVKLQNLPKTVFIDTRQFRNGLWPTAQKILQLRKGVNLILVIIYPHYALFRFSMCIKTKQFLSERGNITLLFDDYYSHYKVFVNKCQQPFSGTNHKNHVQTSVYVIIFIFETTKNTL